MSTAPLTMLSRTRELDRLVAAAGQAHRHATLLVLHADDGMGRTTLARALVRQLEPAGFLSAWAAATPDEAGIPGAVLHQLVAWLAALDGDPPVAMEPVAMDPGPSPDDPLRRAELLAAQLAPRLQPGQAALLVVDDCHHADPASLAALAALVRHHRRLPVVVLLVGRAVRWPGIDPDAAMDLGGLDASAVGQLAAQAGRPMSSAMAHTLQRHTGGNPRDVLALLQALPSHAWLDPALELPAAPTVQAWVAGRMDGLDDTTRDALAALAVLDGHAPLADVGRLAHVEAPDQLLRLADRVEATGLAQRAAGPALALRDPRTAPAVLAGLPHVRVAELHLAAASHTTDEAEALRHLARAAPVPDESLALRLDRAARAREADGQWGRAAELWDLAVARSQDALRRDDRRACALEALVGAGQIHAASVRVALVAQQRETALADAAQGYLAINRGRRDQAARHLERAHDIVSVRHRDVAALIAAHRELHALCDLRGDDLLTWADQTVSLAGATSTAGVEALAIRGLGLALTGDRAAAAQHYRQVRELGGHSAQGQRFAMARGWLALVEDDLESARVELETGAATGRGGSLRIALWSQAWLARVCLLTGEWDECRTVLEQALAAADASGISLVVPLLQWTATDLAVARGDWERAEAAIRAAQRHTHGYRICRGATQLAAAGLAQARSQHDQVVRLLEPLREADRTTFLPWRHLYATSLVLGGRLREAESFLDQECRAVDLPAAVAARLSISRGRLHGAMGQLDQARASFAAGVDHLDAAGLVQEAATARFAAGQTLRRAGRRREADELLQAARQTFLGLGATSMASRCDQELSAGGLHDPGRGVRTDVELTPQEQAVASLVAQGLSNRDVASRLFLSPKTVQYHLTRVYSKLAVRSRTELAAAWALNPEQPE